jgi:hypothetical protein
MSGLVYRINSDMVRLMGNQRTRIAPESLPAVKRRLQILRSAVCRDQGIPDRQADFCRLMGFPVQTWNGYEAGTKGRVPIDTAMALSAALEIPALVAWIYQGAMEKELPGWLLMVIHEERDPDSNGASPLERKRA